MASESSDSTEILFKVRTEAVVMKLHFALEGIDGVLMDESGACITFFPGPGVGTFSSRLDSVINIHASSAKCGSFWADANVTFSDAKRAAISKAPIRVKCTGGRLSDGPFRPYAHLTSDGLVAFSERLLERKPTVAGQADLGVCYAIVRLPAELWTELTK